MIYVCLRPIYRKKILYEFKFCGNVLLEPQVDI